MDKNIRQIQRDFYSRHRDEFDALPLLAQQYIKSLEQGHVVEPEIPLKDMKTCMIVNDKLYDLLAAEISLNLESDEWDIPLLRGEIDTFLIGPYLCYIFHSSETFPDLETGEPPGDVLAVLAEASSMGYQYVVFGRKVSSIHAIPYINILRIQADYGIRPDLIVRSPNSADYPALRRAIAEYFGIERS